MTEPICFEFSSFLFSIRTNTFTIYTNKYSYYSYSVLGMQIYMRIYACEYTYREHINNVYHFFVLFGCPFSKTFVGMCLIRHLDLVVIMSYYIRFSTYKLKTFGTTYQGPAIVHLHIVKFCVESLKFSIFQNLGKGTGSTAMTRFVLRQIHIKFVPSKCCEKEVGLRPLFQHIDLFQG